jgi:serralysin
VFEIRLSEPAPSALSMTYTTVNGTAVAGTDFVARSGSVSFAPGQTTAYVTVQVFGDTVIEGSQTFGLAVQPAAVIASGSAGAVGQATVLDADLSGNDRITGTTRSEVLNGGGGRDTLLGETGNDTISGGAGNDSVRGGGGADSLRGDGGNDTLYGDAGNDIMRGGVGLDRLFGGLGADRFVFDVPAIAANADRIEDFVAAQGDRIILDDDVFRTLGRDVEAAEFRLGTAAADATDRLVYDRASGRLWYDRDGNGAANKVLIATLDPGTALGFLQFDLQA